MTKFFNSFEKLYFWFSQAIFGGKFFFLKNPAVMDNLIWISNTIPNLRKY